MLDLCVAKAKFAREPPHQIRARKRHKAEQAKERAIPPLFRHRIQSYPFKGAHYDVNRRGDHPQNPCIHLVEPVHLRQHRIPEGEYEIEQAEKFHYFFSRILFAFRPAEQGEAVFRPQEREPLGGHRFAQKFAIPRAQRLLRGGKGKLSRSAFEDRARHDAHHIV